MARKCSRARQQLLFQRSREATRLSTWLRAALTRPARSVRILIVEDSSLVLDALRILLEEHGYEVIAADSVESARAAVIERRPDVILLDVVLPDGDGLEVMRAWESGQPPAVIAFTGHSDDATRSRCLAAGCNEVLVKPVSTAALLTVIEALPR